MEIWKEIPGLEGKYSASNKGRIKTHIGIYMAKDRPLKLSSAPSGHLVVRIRYNDCTKTESVHRLIARSFIPNPENKEFINHKNGIPYDNRIENLEWATPSENSKHSFTHLNRKGSQIGRTGGLSPHRRAVIQSTISGEIINRYDTVKQAADSIGLSSAAIIMACKKHRASGGYAWAYEDNL